MSINLGLSNEDEILVETIRKGINVFKDYWFRRPKCKTVDRLLDLDVIFSMIIVKGLVDKTKLFEFGRTYYYLYFLKDKILTILTIPRTNVNKELFLDHRQNIIDAWNKLTQRYSWDKFKNTFPETEQIFNSSNKYKHIKDI